MCSGGKVFLLLPLLACCDFPSNPLCAHDNTSLNLFRESLLSKCKTSTLQTSRAQLKGKILLSENSASTSTIKAVNLSVKSVKNVPYEQHNRMQETKTWSTIKFLLLSPKERRFQNFSHVDMMRWKKMRKQFLNSLEFAGKKKNVASRKSLVAADVLSYGRFSLLNNLTTM